MKIIHIGWVVLSLLFLSIAVFYVSMRIEVTESSYNTYEEMASISNIFESGWIPSWLPKTASQIKESHDIDTNEAWMTFNFSSSDKFYTNCQIMKRTDVLLPTKKMKNRFHNFVSNLMVAVQNNAVVFYRCDDNISRFLAVDQTNIRAYIWVIHS